MLYSSPVSSSSQMPFDWLQSFCSLCSQILIGICVQFVVPRRWHDRVYGCMCASPCIAHTCVFVHSCCIRASLNAISCHPGLSTVAPPVHHGPPVPTAVIPPPPGTHLLFAQTGKIEHLPLEGSTMTKSEAKALLHAPVSGGWWHLSEDFSFHGLEPQAGCGQTRDWD